MLGRAARTSLWHVVGVVIIFACLPSSLSPLWWTNNSISGALQSSIALNIIIIHHVLLGEGRKIWIALAPNWVKASSRLCHSSSRLTIYNCQTERKLARQMDRYRCTPRIPCNPQTPSIANLFALHLSGFLLALLDTNWTTPTGSIDLWTWEIDFWYIVETLKRIHWQKTV